MVSSGARPPFVGTRRRVEEERGRRDAGQSGAGPPLCRPRRRAAALRRGGRGTARVAAARLPAVLVPVEAPGPGAGRGRLPGGCPGHARLQPLGQTARSAGIPRRAAGARCGAPDTGLRGRGGRRGRARLGRYSRLDRGDAPPRAREKARDPQRPPPGSLPGWATEPDAVAEELLRVLFPDPAVAGGGYPSRRIRPPALRLAWRPGTAE